MTWIHVSFPWCLSKWKKDKVIVDNLVVSVIIHTTRQWMYWYMAHVWKYYVLLVFQVKQLLRECQFRKQSPILNGPVSIKIDLSSGSILGTSKSKWFWNTFPNNCTLIACLHRFFTTFAFLDVPVLCQHTHHNLVALCTFLIIRRIISPMFNRNGGDMQF